MADLPINMPSLVQGLSYFTPPALTTDAASTAGAENDRIPNVPLGQPSPLQAMSLATEKDDAPPLGGRKENDLHTPDGWLNYNLPNVGTPER